MNIVLDDAVEVFVKDAKPRRELGELANGKEIMTELTVLAGRILLKGDNITLIQQVV